MHLFISMSFKVQLFIAKNCFSIYTKETQNKYKASFTYTYERTTNQKEL